MKNDIANKLSIVGTVLIVLSIICSIVALFLGINFIYCVLILVNGIIVSFLIIGFSDLIENTYQSMNYQKELLNLLKKHLEENKSCLKQSMYIEGKIKKVCDNYILIESDDSNVYKIINYNTKNIVDEVWIKAKVKYIKEEEKIKIVELVELIEQL